MIFMIQSKRNVCLVPLQHLSSMELNVQFVLITNSSIQHPKCVELALQLSSIIQLRKYVNALMELFTMGLCVFLVQFLNTGISQLFNVWVAQQEKSMIWSWGNADHVLQQFLCTKTVHAYHVQQTITMIVYWSSVFLALEHWCTIQHWANVFEMMKIGNLLNSYVILSLLDLVI